jgi:uncharacterized protein YndB with AHSA1/START domain
MQARASTLIGTTPETAFRFIADPANDRRWRSYLASSRGQVTAPGDRVVQTYTAQGKSKTVGLEVSEYAPPERLSYRIVGPFRARISFGCRPEADGTRVSMSLTAEIDGIASIATGRVEAEVLKIARGDLGRLKLALEGSGS